MLDFYSNNGKMDGDWKKSPKIGSTLQQKRISFHRSGGSKNTSSNTSKKSCSINLDPLLVDTSEIYLEDERAVLPGVPIRAATIPALVRLCIQAFDKNGRVREDFLSYPRVLFLMHQWFIPSVELANIFLHNYDSAAYLVHGVPCCSFPSTNSSSGSGTTTNHNNFSSRSAVEESLFPFPYEVRSSSPSSSRLGNNSGPGRGNEQTCRCEMYKQNIAHALRYWILNFPLHFYVDQRLNEMLHEFGSKLVKSGEGNLAELFDLSIPSYDWIRNISRREAADNRRKEGRKVSLIFNHLEPDELSLHLTFLEHKIIRRINFEDFKNYAQNGSLEENPLLERSVSLFNGLSQWIQCVVLSRPTPQQRADVIVKFVRVAKNLKSLQNFNSLMAVVGSLSHSALARLTKTMDCVPSEERKVLAELTKLVSSSSNFSLYRKALQEAKGFKIPILGVHLKDLISLNTALPDTVENGLINFRKIVQLSIIFQVLQDIRISAPPSQANNDLLNTLRISLDMPYSEDEIYELSLSREPKSSSSSVDGSGGQFSHHVGYQKQVQTLVDAVFRNYDSNHDGFISRDEFQAILSNFPSIDEFFVLDENRDGMISKTEMEKYLFLAGSRHNFIETTYFKPTFCVHCSGLLWGIIRQGFKCRNCNINAHRACIDFLLHECKMGQILFSTSSSPEPSSRRRVFRRRKKSSSQSEVGSSGSPPSPKFFNSLEQLSLSVESNESSPGVLSSSHHNLGHLINHNHSGRSSYGHGYGSHVREASRDREAYSSGQNPLFSLSTPKSPSSSRRFSVLGSNSRPSSNSVPSSPKLGFSSLSVPFWSPCKNLIHSFTTSHQQTHLAPSSCTNSTTSITSVTSVTSTGTLKMSEKELSPGPGGGTSPTTSLHNSSHNSSPVPNESLNRLTPSPSRPIPPRIDPPIVEQNSTTNNLSVQNSKGVR